MGWSRLSAWNRLAIPFLLLVASLTFDASSGQDFFPGPLIPGATGTRANAGAINGQGNWAGPAKWNGAGQWNGPANGENRWQTPGFSNGNWNAVQNYGGSGGQAADSGAFSAAGAGSNAAGGDAQQPNYYRNDVQSAASDATAAAGAGSYGDAGNPPQPPIGSGPPRGRRRRPSFSPPSAPIAEYTPGMGDMSVKSLIVKPFVNTFTDSLARSKTQSSQSRIESFAGQIQSGGFNFDSLFSVTVGLYKAICTEYPDLSCVGAAVQTGVELFSAGFSLLKASSFGCAVDILSSIDYMSAVFAVLNVFGCDELCVITLLGSISSIFM